MLNKILLKLANIRVALCVKLSPLYNKWFFHAKGVKYGNNLMVLGKVNFSGNGMITIGDNFTMTSGLGVNIVSSNLQGGFHIADGACLHIGNNVGMNSTRIRSNEKITIGNNVKIGANVLIIDTDSHPIDYITRRTTNDNTHSAPISIEDDAWIGAQSIILKGVTIGARSIIGAGSVVTKSIPADCIAAGNPCRVIRSLASDNH